MGMAVIRIFDRYIHQEASGMFYVSCNSNPTKTYEEDQLMKKTYSLQIKDGRLREGYLSLSPVTRTTHYRAYLIVQ
jgi:hypothetical protein